MPKIDLFEHRNEKHRRTIILTVTNSCNLKCKYCYEDHGLRTSQILDFEKAKQIITDYMTRDDSFDMVEIQFFGGEPLLAFPLIKQIVDWFHSQEWPKKHIFFIPTNGTVLTDEMMTWLEQNRGDVKLGFSLDGNKKAHDMCRDNSYDRVMKNIPFFQKNWPEQIVKMTISGETLPYVADSVIALEEQELLFAANVVFEDIWKTGEEREELLAIYKEQLSRLVDYYAARPDLFPVCLVDRKIEYLRSPEKKEEGLTKFCGGGVQTVAFDVTGKDYPCHRFIPSFNETNEPPAGPVNERTHWAPQNCTNCKLLSICPTCIAFNWQKNKDTNQRTTYHCDAFKLEILATAKLQALKAKQKMAEAKTDREKGILRQKFEAIIELVNEGI